MYMVKKKQVLKKREQLVAEEAQGKRRLEEL
jgi:hypothetical protein